jgi:hypothetical protein
VGRSPWTGSDAVVLAILAVLGAGGLLVSWMGVSSEANWHHQLSWVAWAVLSVALAGLGVCRWLYRGRLCVRQATAAVWWDLRIRHADREDLSARRQAARTGAPAAGWVSSPTMTRYHRTSCALVRGKTDVSSVTADDIAHRGLRECGACAE